jgi:hypothetical protein
VTVTEAPPSPEVGDRRGSGRAVRVGGVLVSLLATVVTAAAELILTPLRIAGVPVGVAVLVAAAANWGLAWFAVTTTGRRWALGPPWALWTALMFFAAGARTREGDYLLGGTNWVALAMILVGSLTFAIYAYRAILRPPVVSDAGPPANLRDHPPADR